VFEVNAFMLVLDQNLDCPCKNPQLSAGAFAWPRAMSRPAATSPPH